MCAQSIVVQAALNMLISGWGGAMQALLSTPAPTCKPPVQVAPRILGTVSFLVPCSHRVHLQADFIMGIIIHRCDLTAKDWNGPSSQHDKTWSQDVCAREEEAALLHPKHLSPPGRQREKISMNSRAHSQKAWFACEPTVFWCCMHAAYSPASLHADTKRTNRSARKKWLSLNGVHWAWRWA